MGQARFVERFPWKENEIADPRATFQGSIKGWLLDFLKEEEAKLKRDWDTNQCMMEHINMWNGITPCPTTECTSIQYKGGPKWAVVVIMASYEWAQTANARLKSFGGFRSANGNLSFQMTKEPVEKKNPMKQAYEQIFKDEMRDEAEGDDADDDEESCSAKRPRDSPDAAENKRAKADEETPVK